jgi:anti-sigma B factor antagonist
MDITHKTVDQVTVVEIAGDLDGKTAPVAQGQIAPLCQEPGCKIALDMSKVAYMSSAGLRLMLSIYRQVSGAEGQLVLVGLSQDIADTMEATGFLNYFTTCDTLDAGLAAMN